MNALVVTTIPPGMGQFDGNCIYLGRSKLVSGASARGESSRTRNWNRFDKKVKPGQSAKPMLVTHVPSIPTAIGPRFAHNHRDSAHAICCVSALSYSLKRENVNAGGKLHEVTRPAAHHWS